MANRPVEIAARTFGGHGYLAVGVEPGNLAGIAMPDPSQWIERVEVYLKGESGPAWEWTIVPIDGKDVLVVTVDPPQHGDPPWPLRKELQPHRSGTLFVRKAGKTEPALAEDVDALAARQRAGASQLPQLVVDVVGDVPVPWIIGEEVEADVEAWVEQERDRRLSAARSIERERAESKRRIEAAEQARNGLAGSTSLGGHAKWQIAAANMQAAARLGVVDQFPDEPDKRTLEDYTTQLNEWAAVLGEPALNDLPRRYCDAGHGLVHLRVSNTSTQYLPGVEVRVHIAFEMARGLDEVPDGDNLPRPPRPFGKSKPNPLSQSLLGSLASPVIPNLGNFRAPYLRDTTIEDGSIKVTLDVGDLRPTAEYDGDDFYIFLPVRPADGLLHATWTATVQNRDGLIEGHLTIPVQDDPIDVGDLLSS